MTVDDDVCVGERPDIPSMLLVGSEIDRLRRENFALDQENQALRCQLQDVDDSLQRLREVCGECIPAVKK